MNRIGWIAGGVLVSAAVAFAARRLRSTPAEDDDATIEQEIEREVVVEDDGWAFEAANAALDRLASSTPAIARFHVRVLWLSRMLAFTVPGRALYITRTLMDRPGFGAAQIAFALAHEAAHHLLGHLGRDTVRSLVGARLSHLVLGAANELAADAFALRACLDAGFARDDVMKVFDVMEHYAADYGVVAGDDDPRSLAERLRGHPDVRKRRVALDGIR